MGGDRPSWNTVKAYLDIRDQGIKPIRLVGVTCRDTYAVATVASYFSFGYQEFPPFFDWRHPRDVKPTTSKRGGLHVRWIDAVRVFP